MVDREYFITSIIDDLADYNSKVNGGKYDGKISRAALLKLIENDEA
jgi:hypothetical protein